MCHVTLARKEMMYKRRQNMDLKKNLVKVSVGNYHVSSVSITNEQSPGRVWGGGRAFVRF